VLFKTANPFPLSLGCFRILHATTGKPAAATEENMSMQRRKIIPQLLMLLVTTISTQAQPVQSQPQTLEGAWNVTLTTQGITLCTAPAMFSREGTIIADPCSGSVGVGYGAWVRTGNREFAGTFVGNVYGGSTGQVIGSYKVKSVGALQPDGRTFTGVFKTETFDINGNLLNTVTGTVVGKRIVVEPL
jgi:hypothetical protein